MGWWWRSSSTSSTNRNDHDGIENNSSDTANSPIDCVPPCTATFPATVAPTARRGTAVEHTLSRDEQAEAEFRALLAEFQKNNNDNNDAAAISRSRKHTVQPDDDSRGHTPSIYPDTMACAQVFDLAVHCSSLGGQFLNVYRYGSMRDCSPVWQQWRFCMRMKTHADDDRRARVRDWYRTRDAQYKLGASSEDVWKVRDRPVSNPFMGDYEAVEAAWKQQEEQEHS